LEAPNEELNKKKKRPVWWDGAEESVMSARQGKWKVRSPWRKKRTRIRITS